MDIIKRNDLLEAVDGQTIKGAILVMSYEKKMTRGATPKPFLDGVLCSGDNVGLRVWSGVDGLLDKMLASNYSGLVCHITGTINVYQGNKSIVLSSIEAVEGLEPSQFLASKYNIDAYADAYKNLMKKVLSEQGYALLDKILFSNSVVWNKFTHEFCASKHHDNCNGGLLAHSYRMVYIEQFLHSLYPDVFKCKGDIVDTDIHYLGTGLHDIGKIYEMNMGVYQPNSSVTHRQLGCEMLYPFKADIVALYGEKGYYDLISIILQHHHIYGDPARTLPAYITHLIDMIDMQFTSLAEKMESDVTEGVSGDRIFVDKDTILTL